MGDRCWAYIGPDPQQGTWSGKERRIAADPAYAGSERRGGGVPAGSGGAGESTGPAGRVAPPVAMRGPGQGNGAARDADWSRYGGGRDVDDV